MLSLCCACDGSGDAQPHPRLVRLLDALADARIEQPFDPSDTEAVISSQSTSLLSLDPQDLGDAASLLIGSDGIPTPMDSVLADSPGRLAGQADRATLTLRPPETLVRALHATGTGPLFVQAWVTGEEASVVALPLRRGDPPANPSDIASLSERLNRSGLSLAGAGDRAGNWMSTVVPADDDRIGLLLVAVARYRSIGLGRIEVRRLTPMAAALLGRTLRPSDEHVMLGDSAREAMIMPAGGNVSWDLRLPDDAPRLEVDLGVLGVEDIISVRWQVVESDNADLKLAGDWQLGPSNPPWSQHTIDLSNLAGRQATLSISAAGEQGAAVLGRPTIASPAPPGSNRRPDVVLILLDTLRADRTSPGAPTTRRIQALADDAVRFTDASSTSSWTLPAHASLFSSRWPQTHGVTSKLQRLDERTAPLLARAFRDAGYETAAFTGGGFVSPIYGMAAGFERYGVSDPCADSAVSESGEITRQVGARAALHQLLAEPERRPLFAFVHTFAAHHGMPLPDELARFGLDDKDFRQLRDRIQSLTAAQEQQLPQEIDAESISALNSLYDASVLAADELVGDVIDSLVASRRFNDTVLVVTSDHGQELFDRGSFGHGHQLHSELVRIPLIVRAPGAAPGVMHTPVSLVDLAPTLRELAGLPADSGAQGRSLAALLMGGNLPPAPLLSHLGYVPAEPTHVYRREALNLHVGEESNGSLIAQALYDLATDPDERDNLLSRRPNAVASLLEAYEQGLADLRALGVSATAEVSLDPGTRQRLIELGYLSGR